MKHQCSKTKHCTQILGRNEIIKMLAKNLARITSDIEDASVMFMVPSGGDYAGMHIDLRDANADDCVITVYWNEYQKDRFVNNCTKEATVLHHHVVIGRSDILSMLNLDNKTDITFVMPTGGNFSGEKLDVAQSDQESSVVKVEWKQKHRQKEEHISANEKAVTLLISRLRLQPEDIGGPSRMDMLRERLEAANALEVLLNAYKKKDI